MITGDIASSDITPLSGVIRDMHVTQGAGDSVDISFSHVAANPSAQEIGVYVDGTLTDRLPGGSAHSGAANLADGLHTLDVYTNYAGDVWPSRHGNDEGQRAYLQWQRSTDIDCVAYRVYWDEGLGGTPTYLLETVSDIVVMGRIHDRGSDIAGGRVTTYGEPTVYEPINDVVALTLNPDGSCSWATDTDSGSGTFVTGQTLFLPYGVQVSIEDNVASYTPGQTYYIPVGPANFFITDQLAPGTHRFTVCAVDAAGIESARTSVQNVVIPMVPNPVSDVAFAYASGELTVSWVSSHPVRVYSNYDKAGTLLTDHIIEDAPLADTVTNSVTIPHIVDGEYRFYIRPYDGVVERSDATIYTCNLPLTPEDKGIVLSAPLAVRARQISGTHVRLEWAYAFEPGDDLSHFDYYIGAVSTPTFSGSVDSDSGEDYPIMSYYIDLPWALEGTVYLAVRANGGDESIASDLLSIEFDNTPPSPPGELYGVSQ